MFSIILLVLFAASPLVYVQAQSSAASASAALPTSLNQVPPCVLNCTTTAATQAGCNGPADTTCVCTSQKFQANAASCLLSTCSASDQSFAMALQSTICGTQSPAQPASTTAAASPASASASKAPTSAASGPNAGLRTGHVIGLVVGLVGAITGTFL